MKSKTLSLNDLSGAVIDVRIFAETRDGKTCMSPVVFDTINVKITNPRLAPGPKHMKHEECSGYQR